MGDEPAVLNAELERSFYFRGQRRRFSADAHLAQDAEKHLIGCECDTQRREEVQSVHNSRCLLRLLRKPEIVIVCAL